MREDYPLFKRWYRLLDWIFDRCEGYPRSVRFSLTDRIAGLSVDVMSGIIEAIYTKDRLQILDRLNLNIEQLRVLFRLSHDRRYLSRAQYEYVARELDTAGSMIGGWRKRCGG